MIEQEKKLLLTKEEYDFLIQYFEYENIKYKINVKKIQNT